MLRTLFIIGGFQAATVAVSVLRSKLISLSMGPAGLGVIGTIDQFVSVILQLSSLSLPAVAIRLLPRTHDVDPAAFRRQYANFVKVVLLTTTAGTVLVIAALQAYPNLLGRELARFRLETIIALLSAPLMALGLLLPNVLASAQRPTGAAALYFAVAAGTAAATWVGLQLGAIREIYVVQLAVLAALIFGTLVYLKGRLGLPFYSRHLRLTAIVKENPDLLASATVAYIALLGGALSLLAVRSATITALGAAPAGLLQGLLSIVLAVGTVLSAMSGRYLGPLLNLRTHEIDRGAVVELFRRRQLMLLTMMAVPLALFAELALTVLFSRGFIAAGPWLPPFLVWQLVMLQVGIQQQLLFAIDDLTPVAVIAIAGHGLSSALCFLLVPRFGLTGAAAAMLTGALLMNAMGAYRLKRRHNITPHRESRLLTAYVVAIVLAAPYAFRVLGPTTLDVALRIAVCLVIAGGLWLFLDAGERAQFRTYAMRFARR